MDSMIIFPGLGKHSTDSFQIIIPPVSCKIPSVLKFKQVGFTIFISLPISSISFQVILPLLFYTLAPVIFCTPIPAVMLKDFIALVD